MKTKTLILILCTTVISCTPTPRPPSNSVPIVPHLQQNVTISSGTNFETGELVLLNPLSGEQIISCGDIIAPAIEDSSNIQKNKKYPADNAKQQDNECLSQIVSPSSLINLINNNRSVINGTMMRNGKEVKARFSVEVVALFPGSNCETRFRNGKQYEICTSLEQQCFTASGLAPAFRTMFNATCSQFDFW